MELILISDSKLKVMLTARDMENYDITDALFEYENKDVRKIFSGILDEAKRKIGFDCNAGKLMIQVYPSKNGGCEVYITRSEGGECRQNIKEQTTQPKKKKENCVYIFEGISELMAACCVLYRAGYRDDSILFQKCGKDGTVGYYLVLVEEVPQNSRTKKRKNISKSDIASEYGKRMGGKDAVWFLEEHAQPLIGCRTVEKLGKSGKVQ